MLRGSIKCPNPTVHTVVQNPITHFVPNALPLSTTFSATFPNSGSGEFLAQQPSVEVATLVGAVAMPRPGTLCALVLCFLKFEFYAAAFCPGITSNSYTNSMTLACDGSSWYGPLCCANKGPDGLSLNGCLSTAVAQNLALATVSSAVTTIIDNVAAAIYQSTSLDDFCSLVGSALGSTGLPATNTCLQSHEASLAEFGCSDDSSGVQKVAVILSSSIQSTSGLIG